MTFARPLTVVGMRYCTYIYFTDLGPGFRGARTAAPRGARQRRAGMARTGGLAVDEEAAFVRELQRTAEGSRHGHSSRRQQHRHGCHRGVDRPIDPAHASPPLLVSVSCPQSILRD